ncbi:MAG: PEP-CTERM sorting domain-containing protein [Oceanipulchritudo sp.]
MRFSQFITLLAAGGGLFCLSLQADWFPGDPHKMHYPQLPDLNGWDVDVSGQWVVADDFLCTRSGPITEIHFWGSWQGDLVSPIDNIHLSIHADVPAGAGPNPWSQPGPLLWEWNTQDYIEIPWPESGDQGWYEPDFMFIPSDHQGIWQYNVYIPEALAFPQEEGMIYWLDIHVDTPGKFGWKTSLDHWNDDATFALFPGVDPWFELLDPQTSDSLDMAFVIVPEPATVALWSGLLALALLIVRRRRS